MQTDVRIASGLRVVEIGSSAAVAVASMVLADAGAEVIHVEPPGGSPLRRAPAFAMWGRGKQSLVADLSTVNADAPDLPALSDLLLVERGCCMSGPEKHDALAAD